MARMARCGWRGTLSARCGRLPVDECVRIGLALADALAHLHTGERMRVSLQVTETHSGSLLWAEVLTNSAGDPSSVAMAVLQGLPDRLGIQLTDAQRARPVAPPTQNLEAHLLFWEAKGLAQLGTEKASENAVQS